MHSASELGLHGSLIAPAIYIIQYNIVVHAGIFWATAVILHKLVPEIKLVYINNLKKKKNPTILQYHTTELKKNKKIYKKHLTILLTYLTPNKREKKCKKHKLITGKEESSMPWLFDC